MKEMPQCSQSDIEKAARVLIPGKCTGDFFLLTEKKWKPMGVMALEESKVIYVPVMAIDRKIKAIF